MTITPIAITGYGRAGTTVLVQILAHCGLVVHASGFIPNLRAGCEIAPQQALSSRGEAYKNPGLLPMIPDYVRGGWRPGMVVLCLRNVRQAWESRKKSGLLSNDTGGDHSGKSYEEWKALRGCQISDAIHALSEKGVPYRTLWYPGFLKNARYLHDEIGAAHPNLTLERLSKALEDLVKDEWISVYEET
jgi:hypothetical protein